MTDIVEQAARVACPNEPGHDHQPNLDQGCNWALQLCQTLADAGLLAEPARTVPTREQIAVIFHAGFDVRGEGICSSCTLAAENADAVLALMDGQPTVAETKAQALEEFAETWATGEWNDWFLSENVTDDVTAVQATDKALHARAQQIRDGK